MSKSALAPIFGSIYVSAYISVILSPIIWTNYRDESIGEKNTEFGNQKLLFWCHPVSPGGTKIAT